MNDLITNEIKPLTFFRFITAFFVFIFHVKIHLGLEIGINLIDRFILQGAIFMSAFFVLSGFILFFVYYKKDFSIEKNRNEYYIRRIAKIYPSYVFTAILAYFFMNNVSFIQGLVVFPMTILCLQSLFYSTFPYLLNGGLWSLSVEFIFYCLFPFIKQVFLKATKYLKIIILFSYLGTIYPSIVQSYFGGTDDIYVNPLFRIPEFIFGVCVSYIYINRRVEKSNVKQIVFLFILLIVTIGILSKNHFLNHVSFSNNYCYYNFITIPLTGTLIYLFATNNNNFLLKITNNFISNYLGKISYAFYLTQFIAIGVLGKGYFLNKGFISFLAPFIINIIFASLMYEFIEKKCRIKILKKFIRE